MNRHLKRPYRDEEEKIIDEIDKSIRKSVNKLKACFATDTDLFYLLLWQDEIIKDPKTKLMS